MTGRIEFANTLRGLAALSVLISHYYGVYWYIPEAVQALIHRPVPAEISPPFYIDLLQFHPAFHWGYFGVALFFVISGFVIPISLGKQKAASFLLNRAFRILPSYVAGFTICLLAIAFNLAWSGASWPYPISHLAAHYIPGLRDVIGTTNIDGIIWTLEIEVKFYLLCACFASLFMRRSPLVFVVPAALFIVILIGSSVWHLGFESIFGRMIFAMKFIIYMFTGVALYFGYVGAIGKYKSLALGLAILAGFVATLHYHPIGIPPRLAGNYILAFLLFASAMNAPRLVPKNRLTDFFANISYPLYVVHGVAGYTLLAALREEGVSPHLALTIATGAAVFTAYFIHVLVEKPFMYGAKRRLHVS